MASESAATLLERERELAALDDALAAAGGGTGRIALVEAPAGLGKTTLLRAAAERAAAAGFTVLRARAGELERDFAYGCVRQLLEPAVVRAPGDERARLLAGAAALSEPLFAPAGALGPALTGSAFAVLHGLYWLLDNVAAGAPVALVVDDLHWADAETLRFLTYLAPRLDGMRVAVIASTRPGEGDAAELARLATAPETTVLRPGPLSAAATAALCQARLGPAVAPAFAEACRDATAGNPFFLEALLSDAREQGLPTDARAADRVRRLGPAAVAQALLIRLGAQPAAATALVRAAAVLGDGASLPEAARLAGLAEDDAAGCADLLIALGVLRAADALEFVHPIVRAAVLAAFGPRELAAEHARAAAILGEAGAPEERVAAQIAESEPDGDAARVALLRRVAADALRCGAPAAAVAWLSRALAEPPPAEARAGVLLELGSAELRLGAPAAAEHLREAADAISDPERLSTAVRQLANALTVAADADRAVAALESAIDAVAPADPELALLLEAELASHALQARLEVRVPAERRLDRYAGLAGGTPGERLVLASLACRRARASESAGEAAALLEGALAGGRLLREQQLDIVGPFYDLVLGLLGTDALDAAEAALEQALGDARRRASVPGMAFVTSRRGWVAYRRGQIEQAEADARTALELLIAQGIALGRWLALALLIAALTDRGELDEAERELRESGMPDDVGPGPTRNFLLAARGRLRLAAGRTAEGLEDVLEYGRRDERWGLAHPLASRWRSNAAPAVLAAGDEDRARRLAAEDLERARRWGAPSGIGVALRAVALTGAGGPVEELLREAADVLERSPARLEHARALTDLGAALRRAGRRAEAQPVLERGLRLAERCGAPPLAELARTELRAAGGRSADPYGEGAEQLTVSERRVAELAAAGHSNPEIAQALFVTRKTVETHLGRVYRKLGIPGRARLAHALVGPDGAP